MYCVHISAWNCSLVWILNDNSDIAPDPDHLFFLLLFDKSPVDLNWGSYHPKSICVCFYYNSYS